MSKDPVLDAFLEQTFSTTEAASILALPAETLRTELKRGWLPLQDTPREAGQWRRISATDLLWIRLALRLAARGITLPRGQQVVKEIRPEFFGGGVFLWVATNPDGSTAYAGTCSVQDLGLKLFEIRRADYVVLSLNDEKVWLQERINQFRQSESSAHAQK
jgi:hypothetical protein